MSGILAFDTETELMAQGHMAPTVVCVSFATPDPSSRDGIYSGLVHHDQAEPWLRSCFETALVTRTTLVGHNTAYDFACISETWPSLAKLIWQLYDHELVEDTIVRQKLSDLARGRYRGFRTDSGYFVPLTYDLDAVTHRHLGYRLDKDTWRLRYGELRRIPLEQWPQGAREYPIGDAIATLKVRQAQEEDARTYPEGPWFFVDQHAQTRAAWWLHLVSVHGIMTSPDAIETLKAAAAAEVEHLEGPLVEHGLVVNGVKKKKPVQARVIASCAEQGKPPRYTDAGKAQLAAQAKGIVLTDKRGKPKSTNLDDYVCIDRDACLETGDPLLEAYIDYVSAKKTLTSDVEAYGRGTILPLHTRFESLAATGRTTSSGNKLTGADGVSVSIGANIQNVRWNFRDKCVVCGSGSTEHGKCKLCGGTAQQPPGIRECFVPRPGRVFLSADYDGLELKTLAQVCLRVLGYSRLAETINSGLDPHLMVAAQILGRSYEDCLAHLKDPEVQLARQTGKVANFGFPGGLGAEKLVLFARMNYRVRLTVEDAKRLKKTWLETFPEFKAYFKHIDTLEDEDGFFRVQHLFSNRLRSKIFYCVACNSYFQGLGADAAKAAGYLIARACYYDETSPLFGCRIVNFIHDEWILEAWDEPETGWARATAAGNELVRLMALGGSRYLPDVPLTAEPQLMRRWSKKAKRLVDKNTGLLIPWDLPLPKAA